MSGYFGGGGNGGAADGGVAISAGAGTQSTGTVIFSNSNGVSFGLAGGTMTASVGGAAPGSLSAGTTSLALGQVVFQDGNGVSFGLNVSTVTATVKTDYLTTAALSAHSHGVTAGNGGFNFQTLSFSNGNGFSFGTSAGSAITGSYTQSAQAFSADASSTFSTLVFQDSNGISFSNNAGSLRLTHGLQFTSATSAITSNAMHSTSRPAFSADASSTFQTLTFQNSNGISFSNNAGAVRLTHDLQFTSATSAITSNALHSTASRVFNIVAATNNTAGGTASLSSNVSFSAANGFTFYTSAGNAIVGSYTVPTQTNQQMTLFATGNTTQSSTGTSNASSLIFRGSGAASVGITNGSILIDVAAGAAAITQSIGMSTQTAGGGTAGTTGYVTGDDILYHFVPGSNITMSQSVNGASGTLTIYGGGGGGGAAIGVSNTGHTAGNTGTHSSGTIVFAGSSSLTLSMSTGGAGVHTIWAQPAMSQLTAGNNISLSTAGSTISIINLGAGTGFTSGTTKGSPVGTLSTNGLSLLFQNVVMSAFEPEIRGATTTQSMAFGTVFVRPFIVHENISMYRMQMQHSVSTQPTTTQSFSGSVSGAAGSTGATGRVGTTGTFWFLSRESSGTAANSSRLISFYSNSYSQQFDMMATWSNSTNASSCSLRLTTQATLSFVSSINETSYTMGTASTTGSTSFTSTSNAGNTFSSSFGMTYGSSIFSGLRVMQIPMFTSLSPGEYWLAQNWSTSSASTGLSLQRLISFASSVVGFTSNTSGYLRIGAVATTANTGLTDGWGSYSASQSLTSTFQISNISYMSNFQTWFNLLAQVS